MQLIKNKDYFANIIMLDIDKAEINYSTWNTPFQKCFVSDMLIQESTNEK
jgi:hypothetical protein